MKSTDNSMPGDHRRCDELFAEMEQAIFQQRWSEACRLCRQFTASMECQFKIGEELVFPALMEASAEEKETVELMKLQHEQLRRLVSRLAASLDNVSKCLSADADEMLHFTMRHSFAKIDMPGDSDGSSGVSSESA